MGIGCFTAGSGGAGGSSKMWVWRRWVRKRGENDDNQQEQELKGNKVETHMVALSAQDAGVDVFVLSDSWKVVGKSSSSSSWGGGGIEEEEAGDEELGVEEVTAAWGNVLGTDSGRSNVKVWNCYFEATPMSLIKGLVTEYGELDDDGAGGDGREEGKGGGDKMMNADLFVHFYR